MNGRQAPDEVLEPSLLAGMVKPTGIVILGYLIFSPLVGLALFVGSASLFGRMPGGGLATSLLLLSPFILYWVHRFMNLRSREYRFFDDAVETYEGWLNLKNDNVSYDMVTDISFDRPVIQRIFGTGTVRLNTAGSNTHEVHIKYVKDPERVYNRVRTLVWGDTPQKSTRPRTAGRN